MADRRLVFCIDESMGKRVAQVLRELRAPGSPDIHGVHELALRSTSDEVLLRELGAKGFAGFVTKDSSILSAAVHRQALAAAELSLFIMHGKSGNLSLFEQMRCPLWWWPDIVREAHQTQGPAAWTIPAEMKGTLQRRL